ncbi:hypothetical protein BK128_00810 [Viridibacillus sp. FSL H7-0596]|uniref:Transcriptional regulator n=1 Tax=Viridibacillus arenosi FSL R5-213 TaxID=1227360 RepID=W4EM08_9BACL|nr:transcriptional regulator [Viridibacillus arenosi FSL R5-213]OMC88517.1 hypothetical protein BK128_00810 [Viridibacillus sp. FSL H7-0596]OMC93152.1 hypothetical protein BK137_01115 [Viridibacillus arenosi]
MLLSKAWEAFESDKRIEGFSPQTLKAYRLQMITAEGSAILKMEQNRLLHILSLYEGSESNEEI